MDPTPYFIMGALMGCGGTLLIQVYGRRKVKKAVATIRQEAPGPVQGDRARLGETAEMARRLAVLEQIVTDRPMALAEQIEGLRREAM